ncbi:MAG: T9SS type A sorting domain-containing protein [Chitinophagaceae bacterium]|nr:T9SS type A sorting domain-containing protein [Chitinophagaceae bacterium]
MKHLYLLTLVFSIFTSVSFAQSAITAANTTDVTLPASGSTYNANGATGSAFSGTNFNYRWGAASGASANKVFLNSFVANSNTYVFDYGFSLAIVLNRVNNSVVSGIRDLVYNEGARNTSPNPDEVNINAPYVPAMTTLFIGNDDLRSGTDNLFGNQGDGSDNNNNIERLDVRINGNDGYLIGNPALEGFAVFERGAVNAHDPFVVSVITSLDGMGNPNGYTGLYRAVAGSYGATNPIPDANYMVTRRDGGVGNLLLSAIVSTQGVGGIFFRFSDFGFTAGTRVYGYSLTANDFPVSATAADMVDFTNATNFPLNTTSATSGGGIDLTAITGVFKIFNDDNDAIPNNTDVDDDNDGITDLNENNGADGFGDADGDGILNFIDPSYAGFVDANGDDINDNFDADQDSRINQVDLDSDNDGIPDLVEAGGVDTDGDGRIDGIVSDTDGDGLLDAYDASTGGDAIANRNTDGDTVPNAYDLDSDNDGIPDTVEARGIDADNDGRIDGVVDIDNDGFSDTVDGDVGNDGTAENTGNALMITGADGDSNGAPDTYTKANTDAIGLPDPYDLDADGDGILDTKEAGIADADNNGVADGTTGADGWSDTVDGLPALNFPNNDADSYPDCRDIDSDDDGLTDNVEGQTTAGYQLPSGSDTDADGIDDVYDNNDGLFAGNANNGISPNNHDGADTPDYIDTDSDNDTANDLKEGTGDINATLSNTTDTDGDGLVDQFDTFNLILETANLQNNVTLAGMGNGGSTTGPTPAGSNVIANQTPGGAPDRDWRNNLFILPVQFVDLWLTVSGNTNVLHWTVAEEVNVKEYIIERSFDGIHFSEIGSTPYRSQGSGLKTYTYSDHFAGTPGHETMYYRIREVDIDGTRLYSKIIAVKLSGKKNGFSVRGNPVAVNRLTLLVAAEKAGNVKLRIIDMQGRILVLREQSISAGSNILHIDNEMDYWTNGIYLVQADINGQLFTEKINILR